MDPQAAWTQLQEAYHIRDWEAVRELAQSLLDWLELGGFPPVTSQEERLSTAQHRAAVEQFCQSVLQEWVEAQHPLCECFRPNL